MPAVSAPNRCDSRGMARCGKPVVNRRPDFPAPNGRVVRTGVASDQQDDSLSSRDCAIETAIDRRPRLVEIETVEIEHAIRFDRA